MSAGTIIMGVIAAIVVIAVIILIVWSFRREGCSGGYTYEPSYDPGCRYDRLYDHPHAAHPHVHQHPHLHSMELTIPSERKYRDLLYGGNRYRVSGVDHQHGRCGEGGGSSGGGIDTLFSGHPGVMMWNL